MDEYERAKKQKYSVKLSTILKEIEVEMVHEPENLETKYIDTSDVNRPGLQLTGFYDYFDNHRIQVMGIVETTYLNSLSAELRYDRLRELMSRDICAIVICHDCEILPECLSLAKEFGVCLVSSSEATSDIIARLTNTLKFHLAPRITQHGVLMEVFGEGLLLLGESGIGKSETALELINRGHRLIADDAVVIRRAARQSLVGSAPEIIRYHMELRGIGVVDIRRMYGMGAVKPSVWIDLVVQLEFWEKGAIYDRLGIDTDYHNILGVMIPTIKIPVRPGRNLAVILELAAKNNRQKKMGHNAARVFAENHDRMIDAATAEINSAEFI